MRFFREFWMRVFPGTPMREDEGLEGSCANDQVRGKACELWNHDGLFKLLTMSQHRVISSGNGSHTRQWWATPPAPSYSGWLAMCVAKQKRGKAIEATRLSVILNHRNWNIEQELTKRYDLPRGERREPEATKRFAFHTGWIVHW